MFTSKIPWIALLFLWMAGAAWWHVCRIKQLCVDYPQPVSAATTDDLLTTVAPEGLTVTDGNRFRLALPGNFSFARSGANANLNTLTGSLDSLTAYLKANPGRKLTITGYYATNETSAAPFANVGLARAEGIKQFLVQQSIPATSLVTSSSARTDLAFTPAGDSLYGGIGFVFTGMTPEPTADSTLTDITTVSTATAVSVSTPSPMTVAESATEESLAAAEKFTSVFEPIDLYFSLNGASYIKTPETTKFFAEAAKYLSAHKNRKLLLTGYTDNSGSDAANLRLSRERAKQVSARLRQLGIDQGQVAVEAKGEADPKASNETREGRKANRRVMVVVQ